MNFKKCNIIKIIPAILFLAAAIFSYQSYQAKAANDSFNVLWQAKTYTPYWYQGKAMASINSEVKAVVINLSPYSSSHLIYDWYVNFEKDFKGSGKGKSSFTTTIDRYEDIAITVKIYDENKKLIAEKGTILSANNGQPKMVFYRQDPLSGALFNLALPSSFQLEGDSVILKAEPYFFSFSDEKPAFDYVWKMNGNTIPQPTNKDALILKKPAGKAGSSLIEAEITNSENIYQTLKKEIRINYGIL